MPSRDPSPPPSAFASAAGVVVAVGLATLFAIQYIPAGPTAASGDSLGAPPTLAPCAMAPDGYWRGQLTGTASIDIDWQGSAFTCGGNARPGGRGLRLFLAGRPGPEPDRLVLVLGLAAGIGDLAGREHPVSLTLIDEQSSQFFHSPGDRCFTRVAGVTPLGPPGEYRVEGDLWCIGAVAAVSGDAALTLGEMAYAVRLTLEDEG